MEHLAVDCHTETNVNVRTLQTGRDPENCESQGVEKKGLSLPPSLAKAQGEMKRGRRHGWALRVKNQPAFHALFKERQTL